MASPVLRSAFKSMIVSACCAHVISVEIAQRLIDIAGVRNA